MLSQIKILIQENPEVANFGKIIITGKRLVQVLADESSTVPTDPLGNTLPGPFIYGGLQYKLKITSPLGQVLRESTVLMELTSTVEELEVVAADLPKDTDGEAISGKYTFDFIVTMMANGNEVSFTNEYNYDKCEDVTANLVSTFSCTQASITVEDQTDYKTNTVVARELSLVHPAISDEAKITTASKLITSKLSYDNSEYTSSLKASIQLVGEETTHGDHTVQVTCADLITADDCVAVSCSIASCSYIDAFSTAMKEIEEKACSVGGLQRLSDSQFEKYTLLTSGMTLVNAYIGCGETAKALAQMQSTAKLVNITVPAPSPVKFSTDDSVAGPWIEIDEGDMQTGFTNYRDGNNDVVSPLRYKLSGGFLIITGRIIASNNPTNNTILLDYFASPYTPDATTVTPAFEQQSWSTFNAAMGIARLREISTGKWTLEFYRSTTFNASNVIEFYLQVPV